MGADDECDPAVAASSSDGTGNAHASPDMSPAITTSRSPPSS
jgi:hypothetical protein